MIVTCPHCHEFVWIDDIEWDENRKVAAERRINDQGLN